MNGAARTIDLFGTFNDYNTSNSDDEADTKALSADWQATMSDFSTAFAQVASDLGKK